MQTDQTIKLMKCKNSWISTDDKENWKKYRIMSKTLTFDQNLMGLWLSKMIDTKLTGHNIRRRWILLFFLNEPTSPLPLQFVWGLRSRILYFPLAQNALCSPSPPPPPQFCINYCCEMLLAPPPLYLFLSDDKFCFSSKTHLTKLMKKSVREKHQALPETGTRCFCSKCKISRSFHIP